MKKSPIDVSICILAFNNQDLLKNCLSSLYQKNKNVSFEVIVVDNASKDNTVSMLKTKFPKISLILNKKNRFIKAYNQALKKIKGRYFLLLNEDTEVFPNTLKKMLLFMDKDPKIGLSSCKQIDEDGSVDFTCSRNPTPLLDLVGSTIVGKQIQKILKVEFFKDLLNDYRYLGWRRNGIKEVDVLPGPFFLGRSQLIREIGFIDEKLILFYIEADYCIRAKKAGYKIVYNGNASIKHLRAKGLAKLPDLKRFQISAHDTLYFHKKYSGLVWFFILWLFLRFDLFYWKFLYKKD